MHDLIEQIEDAGLRQGVRQAPAGKLKVQREIFTMLPAESNKIDEVRTRAAANKFFTTRSAVIRAGVMALELLSDEQLVQVLGRLPVVKPGRGA